MMYSRGQPLNHIVEDNATPRPPVTFTPQKSDAREKMCPNGCYSNGHMKFFFFDVFVTMALAIIVAWLCIPIFDSVHDARMPIYEKHSNISLFEAGEVPVVDNHLVELFDPFSSALASPAIVTSISSSKGAISYNVINLANNIRLENVEGYLVHPYTVYDSGSLSVCNVGSMPNPMYTSCTVVSHLHGDQGNLQYRVMLAESATLDLPFSMVERKLPMPPTDEGQYIQSGGLVEVLHSEVANFALPARIVGGSFTKEGLPMYDVRYFVNNIIYKGLEQSEVRLYQAYKEGSDAVCDVGTGLNYKPVPCIVLSHSNEKNQGIIYTVAVEGGNEKELSYTRLMRVVNTSP